MTQLSWTARESASAVMTYASSQSSQASRQRSEYRSSIMNLHISFISTYVDGALKTVGLYGSFGVSIIVTVKPHRCTAHRGAREFISRK